GGAGGARRIAQFLHSLEAKGFEVSDLIARVNSPVRFVPPKGGLADGYEATILPDVCEVVVKADQAGRLHRQQRHVADQCRILLHGFANVGIIALVDEATGYQDARAKDALAKILEQFVAKEYRKWVRTFPLDYYREMCRLRGVPFPTTPPMRLPQYFGHLTNDVVYSRMAPFILEELRSKNPAVEGRRKQKHFQWLTDNIGDPRLREHLWKVITLMQVYDHWDAFYETLERILPKYSNLPLLALLENERRLIPSSNEPVPPS
ncbi:MAG: P63C domain-containing protein, partial [Acidobacteria bacterium]|nr:P63C domain-containing protein [Acidobacteriota bacterium]